MGIKEVKLSWVDRRLCWTLPYEDLYTALLLECGPIPGPGNDKSAARVEWYQAVRSAAKKYYRHDAPAGRNVVQPNMISEFVRWIERRRALQHTS